MFRFRPVEPADFPLLLAWLARPHVKEWWDDGDDTLEKVAEHYSGTDAARFIVHRVEDGRAIGYIQYYREDADAVGVDMFIGEPDLIGRGVGPHLLRSFLDLVDQRENPRTVIVDPDPRNERAIRCYTKVGFQPAATITNDEGHPALIMRLRRGAPTPRKEGTL